MVARVIRRTTAEQVAESIQLSILTGEFPAGSRLPPERKLCAMLGVSRTTLREGVSRLIATGLVVGTPGLGTFVTSQDIAFSLVTLPAQYLNAQVAQRRIELVRHYLELRRFAFAAILKVACERATQEGMYWIGEAFHRIGALAEHDRDLAPATAQELRAIHVAAEHSDAYSFWLLLNHLTDFYRVAKKDLLAVETRSAVIRRSEQFANYLKSRDAKGVVEYIDTRLAQEDRVLLMALEERARANAGAPGDAIANERRPIQEPIGNVPAGVRPDGGPAFCFHCAGEPLGTPAPAPGGLGMRGGWADALAEAATSPEILPPVAEEETVEEGHDDVESARAERAAELALARAQAAASVEAQSDTSAITRGAATADAASAETPPAAQAGEVPDPPQQDPVEPAPRARPIPGPRCDPASWYPNYIDWHRRTFQCSPWEVPSEEPPGDELPEFTPE